MPSPRIAMRIHERMHFQLSAWYTGALLNITVITATYEYIVDYTRLTVGYT